MDIKVCRLSLEPTTVSRHNRRVMAWIGQLDMKMGAFSKFAKCIQKTAFMWPEDKILVDTIYMYVLELNLQYFSFTSVTHPILWKTRCPYAAIVYATRSMCVIDVVLFWKRQRIIAHRHNKCCVHLWTCCPKPENIQIVRFWEISFCSYNKTQKQLTDDMCVLLSKRPSHLLKRLAHTSSR